MDEFRILVVDDEAKLVDRICTYLQQEEIQVTGATSFSQALEFVASQYFNLIITDYRLSTNEAENGIVVIQKARQINPNTKAILISAFASLETGVQAIDAGAAEVLTKPVRLPRLLELVKKFQTETAPLAHIDTRIPAIFDQIVVGGIDSPMRAVYELLPRIVKSESTVLIRGESGTGKEVIARAIHKFSTRKDKPFVQVNCAALVESLLESELFGIEERVATGVKARPGKFELAEGGILFLDEIGDMSLATQTKVLRALQDKEITRVGSNKPIKVDVRVITATNQNLEEAIKQGKFREDLFYRINVITIFLPPLRARAADIPFYVTHFLDKHLLDKPMHITQRALEVLMHYDWPGNVRELENTIERAIALANSETIDLTDLPESILQPPEKTTSPSYIIKTAPIELKHTSLDTMEKNMIIQALEQVNWNQTKAAKILGITRRKLGYKIEKYNLKKL